MGRFTPGKKKELPAISTASLAGYCIPAADLFMVTTTIREATVNVRVAAPSASEAQKLEKKGLTSYIYIGPPVNARLGTESRIQLNDRFATLSDIRDFVIAEREARDEVDRPFITTSLKVDKSTRMGVVTDVKQELRQIGAFKINYSSRKEGKHSQ